jgi:hypothetical protein
MCIITKKEKNHKYYENNREKFLQRQKIYQKTHIINKDKRKEYRNRQYYKNVEKSREKALKYYHDNITDNKKYKNALRGRIFRATLRKKALYILGEVCVICGKTDIRYLQIDHIHGGGTKERLNSNYDNIYRKIILNPEKSKLEYQLLCANHNIIKRIDTHEYIFEKKMDCLSIIRREQQKIKREKVLSILGRKCCFCGYDDVRCLQRDHIHGGGTEEHRRIGSHGILNKILSNPEKYKKEYQMLCANCNSIKKYENNETSKKY